MQGTLPRSETVLESVDAIATPAMVIDGPTVVRNLEQLAAYASQHRLNVRPHTKTHKSRVVGRMQMEAGASGLTAAKVGETELMAEVCEDVLMAYPAVDRPRCERLAKLAHQRTVRVGIDTATAIEALAAAARAAGSTIGLLVEIDVGLRRTGVATAAESLALAQLVDRTAGVRLDGIMCYPGQIGGPAELQRSLLEPVAAQLQEAIDVWTKSGLAVPIVSGGSTPTLYRSHLVPQYTEIRPGTYVYYDTNCVRGGWCTLDDCAARLVCTVVSDAVKGQFVIDGGTKTFTSDLCGPARDSGHGIIVEYPDAKIARLTEEHGIVDASRCERRPKVGERVTVIPNHICPCVNLQDIVWWRESDGTVRPLEVDARGKLS